MNLDARLTAQLAALAVGVSKQTFNYWRAKGKVAAGEDGLYRYGDVLKVEAQARRSNKSHRGKRRKWADLDINSDGMLAAG